MSSRGWACSKILSGGSTVRSGRPPHQFVGARSLAPMGDFLAPAQALDVLVGGRADGEPVLVPGVGVAHDVAQRIGALVVPVGVERLHHLGHERPERQHVHVGEGDIGGRVEVFVADVATAKDRRLTIGDERLDVHAAVEAIEVGRQVPHACQAAIPVRVEQPHLDVVERIELRKHRIEPAAVVVVEQQAHAHAARRRSDQLLDQPLPGAIGAPDVALDVEAAIGALDHPGARSEGRETRLEDHKTRHARVRAHHRRDLALERAGGRRRQRLLRRHRGARRQPRASAQAENDEDDDRLRAHGPATRTGATAQRIRGGSHGGKTATFAPGSLRPLTRVKPTVRTAVGTVTGTRSERRPPCSSASW